LVSLALPERRRAGGCQAMIDPCLELSRHRLARAREAFADGEALRCCSDYWTTARSERTQGDEAAESRHRRQLTSLPPHSAPGRIPWPARTVRGPAGHNPNSPRVPRRPSTSAEDTPSLRNAASKAVSQSDRASSGLRGLPSRHPLHLCELGSGLSDPVVCKAVVKFRETLLDKLCCFIRG